MYIMDGAYVLKPKFCRMESQNNEDIPFTSDKIRDMRRMMQRHREDQSRQSNNTASPSHS